MAKSPIVRVPTNWIKDPSIHFRPHNELAPDYNMLMEWIQKNPQHSFNSILNSFLPAIVYSILNTSTVRRGKRYVVADFGEVLVRETKARTGGYNRYMKDK